jgi:DNA replication protein DnaC
MDNIQNLTNKALTGVSAQQTKASPANMETSQTDNVQKWATWLNLKTYDDNALIKAVLQCRDFAKAFTVRDHPRWITFLGVTGTGKTHMARRLWDSQSSRVKWHNTKFIQHEVYWPKLVSELRSGNAFEKVRDMMSWPVLFLDDICAERDTTGFTSEQLNMLLGCRENKWTIITSNKLLGQIAELEPRIADRMIRNPNILVELKTISHSLR